MPFPTGKDLPLLLLFSEPTRVVPLQLIMEPTYRDAGTAEEQEDVKR